MDKKSALALTMMQTFKNYRKACADAGEHAPGAIFLRIDKDGLGVRLGTVSTPSGDDVDFERFMKDATSSCFAAYNAGGPSERANLTWDGKPVPAFDAVGPVVQHKWQCAAATAARAGAAHVLELMKAGITDPETLRLLMETTFHTPAWSQGE